MGYNLTEQQIRDGLQRTTWRGRFTIIQKEPYVIMDGAHNPAAAQTLRDSLQIYFPGRRLHYVFGMFQDKDYPAVIALTAPLAEHIITVETPDNPRALPAKELAQEEELIFLCGHYEGIDERVIEEIVTDPVSIGDYVLTGGELPAMVMIDAISRMVPGVLKNEASGVTESFQENLLEYPQYTRPEVWESKKVPDMRQQKY